MQRAIIGYHRDEAGDWVADLACLHGQHVRHHPPFRHNPWAVTAAGRASRLGSPLDCPRCDRAEPPDGVRLVRTPGPWDADTLPAGLRQAHLVAQGTWGRLRVLEGRVAFSMQTHPPTMVELATGASQPIPPGVPHAVEPLGPARLAIDVLTRP